MSRHTHTEWLCVGTAVFALNLEGSNRFYAHVQGGWETQGRTRTSDAELEANARLIAAAPDLLEALQDAEASLATLFESGDFGMEDRAIEFGMDALADIRAAIARATQPLPPPNEE